MQVLNVAESDDSDVNGSNKPRERPIKGQIRILKGGGLIIFKL